jgi:hypothetical protein
MNHKILPLFIGLICQALLLGCSQSGTKTATDGAAGPKNEEMVRAVQAFLGSLTPEQRQKATYPFEDEERFNWNFVPIERNGVPLKEMNESQRQLAMAVLQTALSEQGYGKAKAIMELEVVLKALENLPPENERRDPEKYYFTVFGQPSEQDPWGWRVEGHHLSLNFSSLTGAVVAETPAFMGSNPAIVPDGPQKGKQILKEEAALGFALVNSFTPEQLQKALIAEVAPNEIVTSNSRKAMIERPEGILYPEMTAEQQRLFNQLLEVYLHKYKKEIAQSLRAKVEEAGMDNMRFAWAGSREEEIGKAHYYRIHNPVLLIEYDNSQNNANHAHTVVRDLKNDFGEDALREHYERHQHKK